MIRKKDDELALFAIAVAIAIFMFKIAVSIFIVYLAAKWLWKTKVLNNQFKVFLIILYLFFISLAYKLYLLETSVHIQILLVYLPMLLSLPMLILFNKLYAKIGVARY